MGRSREDLKDFPKASRRRAGFELREVQRGGQPSHYREMPEVGAGAIEIRISLGGAFRVFYVAKFEEAVYVLHAFRKKSEQTAPEDMELGRKRYRDMLTLRGKR
jgi:phage-related protein